MTTSGTMETLREYLTLKPIGASAAFRLYTCYALASMARIANPGQYRGVGAFLAGSAPIEIQNGSLMFHVRPKSEDLSYLLPSHKATVARWFNPQRGESVVDVGTHVGFYTILAASRGASVLAIEPNPSTAHALRENLALNQLANVGVVEVAIGEQAGIATLEVPRIWDGMSSLVPGWATGGKPQPGISKSEVRVRALDEVVHEYGLTHVDWLLVDVEGYELEALRGGSRTLAMTRNLILEVSSPARARCRDILTREHGFRIDHEERQTELTDYWVARKSVPA